MRRNLRQTGQSVLHGSVFHDIVDHQCSLLFRQYLRLSSTGRRLNKTQKVLEQNLKALVAPPKPLPSQAQSAFKALAPSACDAYPEALCPTPKALVASASAIAFDASANPFGAKSQPPSPFDTKRIRFHPQTQSLLGTIPTAKPFRPKR